MPSTSLGEGATAVLLAAVQHLHSRHVMLIEHGNRAAERSSRRVLTSRSRLARSPRCSGHGYTEAWYLQHTWEGGNVMVRAVKTDGYRHTSKLIVSFTGRLGNKQHDVNHPIGTHPSQILRTRDASWSPW